jgi:hypothetical protein
MLQTGMNLKRLMAAAPDADHDFDSASSIATATTVTAPSTIAASSAITSPGAAGIAGVARSRMIAAMPVGIGMRMGVAGASVAEIAAAVRSGAIRGPSPVSLTLLRLLDQQQANQRRPAECDAEDHHRVRHGVP